MCVPAGLFVSQRVCSEWERDSVREIGLHVHGRVRVRASERARGRESAKCMKSFWPAKNGDTSGRKSQQVAKSSDATTSPKSSANFRSVSRDFITVLKSGGGTASHGEKKTKKRDGQSVEEKS